MDKLTVATLLTLRIAVNDSKLHQEEVDYLVEGKLSADPGECSTVHCHCNASCSLSTLTISPTVPIHR